MKSKTIFKQIIFLAIALRTIGAFYSIGFVDPNEVYRLLEPIADFLGYGTQHAWEWNEGLLSQIPIWGHLFFIEVLQYFGLENPIHQTIILRILYGWLSVFQVYVTWKILDSTGTHRTIVILGTLVVAIWPEWIFRSLRLMDYSLEASVFAVAILLCWTRKSFALTGVIMGILFFYRYQSGLLFLCLIPLIYSRTQPYFKKSLGLYIGSYGITVFSLAVLEAVLTGEISQTLRPFWDYILFNFIQDGASEFYGIDPWHRYFSESAKIFGFAPFIVLLGLLLKKNLRRPLTWLWLAPFVVYSLIGHKEDRFILGFSWVLIPAALAGLSVTKKQLRFLYLIFLVGWIFQIQRNLPKFTQRADLVREFTAIGGQNRSLPPKPLLIQIDPSFSPGGFFIRNKEEICYETEIARPTKFPSPNLHQTCTSQPHRVLFHSPDTGNWELKEVN